MTHSSMPHIPVPTIYRNTVIGPLRDGSNKYELHFGASPSDVKLSHYRQSSQGIVDIAVQSDLLPEESSNIELVEYPVIYGGPIFYHFGHFIAESIHRIYAKHQFNKFKNCKIAFHASGSKKRDLLPWMVSVLKVLGIKSKDVLLIDKPIRFSTLVVPKPGRILGGRNLFQDYNSLFPLAPIKISPQNAAKILYVSRSEHIFSGGYLGEALVEDILEEHGVRVVRPESLPLSDFLSLFLQAEKIIASEGSAIHNLELCGKTNVEIFLIARRSGAKARFQSVLENLTDRSVIFEQMNSGVALEWDWKKNTASRSRAVSFVDIPALLQSISEFSNIQFSSVHPSVIRTHILADLARYLLDARTTRSQTTSHEQLGKLFELFRESGQKNLNFACGLEDNEHPLNSI